MINLLKIKLKAINLINSIIIKLTTIYSIMINSKSIDLITIKLMTPLIEKLIELYYGSSAA